MSFEGFGKSSEKRDPDCHCYTCDKDIHHLGIMSHRAMHRRRNENCKIQFSSGETFTYKFGANNDQ
jgi:hypothetical protein